MTSILDRLPSLGLALRLPLKRPKVPSETKVNWVPFLIS
jgi:hypothetical protein